jgi:hypothetical protein
MKPTTTSIAPQSERAISVLAGSLIVGCLFIPLYASQTSSAGQFAAIVGVALVIACSALLLGGLLGFLFGIPRTLQQEGGQTTQQYNNERQETRYAVNTNLEQISDWLTKILVGVGLTQLANLPASLIAYANYAGAGLGNFPSSGVFSIALLLFFLADGFLISYLWTRLYFKGALEQADARFVAIETKLDQIDIDAKAWSLAIRLLNPGPGYTPPSQAEINAVIVPASDKQKAQIYWEASQVRSDNWQNPADKPKMERTIPIFRALIASDTEGVYHANHGQLGYALADQRNPNWSEARAELTEAIRIRGNWQASDWLTYYELVRAICSINLDRAYKNAQPTDAITKQAIVSDLEVACSHAVTREVVENEVDIKKWMVLNNVMLTQPAPDLLPSSAV